MITYTSWLVCVKISSHWLDLFYGFFLFKVGTIIVKQVLGIQTERRTKKKRQTNGRINQESESAECGVQLSLAGQSVMDVNSYVSRLRENLDTFVCLSFCVSVCLYTYLFVYFGLSFRENYENSRLS